MKCPNNCDNGAIQVIRTETTIVCCGNPSPHGDCCGNGVMEEYPVEDFEPCQWCAFEKEEN